MMPKVQNVCNFVVRIILEMKNKGRVRKKEALDFQMELQDWGEKVKKKKRQKKQNVRKLRKNLEFAHFPPNLFT